MCYKHSNSHSLWNLISSKVVGLSKWETDRQTDRKDPQRDTHRETERDRERKEERGIYYPKINKHFEVYGPFKQQQLLAKMPGTANPCSRKNFSWEYSMLWMTFKK